MSARAPYHMDASDTVIYVCQKAQTVPGKGNATPVGIPCVRPQSDMRCYMLDRCGIESGSWQIIYHRSMPYELSIYCSSLIYFSVAIAIVTTKYQKHYFSYRYLLLSLPLLSYYFATKHSTADTKFPGVVELTTQLLTLENILWLPLCLINKFGLNTLPPKTVAFPYTCGL